MRQQNSFGILSSSACFSAKYAFYALFDLTSLGKAELVTKNHLHFVKRAFRILHNRNKTKTDTAKRCLFSFGSRTRIRTQTNRVRVCCATLTQSGYMSCDNYYSITDFQNLSTPFCKKIHPNIKIIRVGLLFAYKLLVILLS